MHLDKLCAVLNLILREFPVHLALDGKHLILELGYASLQSDNGGSMARGIRSKQGYDGNIRFLNALKLRDAAHQSPMCCNGGSVAQGVMARFTRDAVH